MNTCQLKDGVLGRNLTCGRGILILKKSNGFLECPTQQSQISVIDHSKCWTSQWNGEIRDDITICGLHLQRKVTMNLPADMQMSQEIGFLSTCVLLCTLRLSFHLNVF